MNEEDTPSSPSCNRNPSPPPHLQEQIESLEADRIGNTTYSKHWLFTTLMKLIEEVEKEDEAEFGVDVDEELQNELCKLWDMSMNTDVAKFLEKFKAVDILTGVIQRSKAPRVTEICVGILGNMACDSDICESLSKNQQLLKMVLLLLEGRDPPTLVETTRLMFTCLSCNQAKSSWLEVINSSESLHDHIIFILQSSTNVDLLKNTGEFVDVLLDLQEDMCENWATAEFVQALLEAIKQIGLSHSQQLEIYFRILQLLSTTDAGAEALVSCADAVEKPLVKYLNTVCDDEIVGIENKESCIASALSVLNILFSSNEETSNRLIKDEKLIRVFVKILEPLYPWLQDIKKSTTDQSEKKRLLCENSGNVEKTDLKRKNNDHASDTDKESSFNSEIKEGLKQRDDKEFQHLEILYHIVEGFVYDYMFTLQLMIDSDSENESEEETQKTDVTKFLSYLNDSCSRCRINYLVLTMKESINEAFNPTELLTDLAAKHKKERLARITADALAGRNLDRSNSNTDSQNNT